MIVRLILLIFMACPAAALEDAPTLIQTNCENCTLSTLCASDATSSVYKIPTSTCYSPPVLFPSDPLWGALDVLDVCKPHYLERTFFSSTNGTCCNATDVYKLRYDKCLGPFDPVPWGTFECNLSGIGLQ